MQLAPETLPDTRVVSRVKLAECEKILVVKLDRLGDFVLATPFLRGLRKSAPHARIDLVVMAEAYELAQLCPYVDRVTEITGTDSGCDIRTANRSEGETFLADFTAGDFDLALIPRWDYDFCRATAFAAAAKARNIVAFAKPAEYNLEDYGKFCTETLDRPFLAHEVEHNLALLEYVGGTADGCEPEVWINKEDRRAAAGKLVAAIGDEPFLAVFPGAAHGRRTLPAEKLCVILARLSAMFEGLRFVLLGGPSDEESAQKSLAGLAAGVSLCGKTSVREAIAIAGFSFAAIAMDSAPAHFSAAVNVPVVVFSCHPLDGDPGDVHSPARFGPRGLAERVVLQPPETLWPCEDRCRAKGPHCIVNITEEAAVMAISGVIQRRMASLSAAKSSRT